MTKHVTALIFALAAGTAAAEPVLVPDPDLPIRDVRIATALAFAKPILYDMVATPILPAMYDIRGHSSGGGVSVAGTNVWTGSNTFKDNAFIIEDEADTSKDFVFSLSGITAGNAPALLIAGTTANGPILSNVRAINFANAGTSDVGLTRLAAAGLKVTDSSTNFGYITAGNSINQIVTAGQAVANDNSTNFLDVTGTMPTAPTATVNGVEFNITSAGSTAQQQRGVLITLAAGYTGAQSTHAINVINSVAGTRSDLSGFDGNTAFGGSSSATTVGANFGIAGGASGGNINVGVAGKAITSKASATNIGGFFLGRQTTATVTEVGVYAGLNSTTPTLVSSALIADNSDQAVPIFLARDNGTTVLSVEDGGTVASGSGLFTREFSGNKANITEAAAQAIVRVTLPTAGMYGATVFYTVHDSDGTDHIARSGNIVIQGVNKAGTNTCTIATTRDQETEDGSSVAQTAALTLTYTWTNVVSTVNCDLSLNAASNAGANTYDISYKVILTGNSTATTITAQ